MRDAFPIIGKKINYNEKEWTIKDFYVVPGNPELYIGLIDNKVTMNVRLSDIMGVITKEGVGEDSVPASERLEFFKGDLITV